MDSVWWLRRLCGWVPWDQIWDATWRGTWNALVGPFVSRTSAAVPACLSALFANSRRVQETAICLLLVIPLQPFVASLLSARYPMGHAGMASVPGLWCRVVAMFPILERIGLLSSSPMTTGSWWRCWRRRESLALGGGDGGMKV